MMSWRSKQAGITTTKTPIPSIPSHSNSVHEHTRALPTSLNIRNLDPHAHRPAHLLPRRPHNPHNPLTQIPPPHRQRESQQKQKRTEQRHGIRRHLVGGVCYDGLQRCEHGGCAVVEAGRRRGGAFSGLSGCAGCRRGDDVVLGSYTLVAASGLSTIFLLALAPLIFGAGLFEAASFRLLAAFLHLFLLLLAQLLFAGFGVFFFLFERVQGEEEGFFALVVEDLGHGDELAGVVPFFVAREDVQGVELEELDAGVEVAGGVGAVLDAALGLAALVRGRGHVGGDVQGRGGGRGQICLELLLVQALGRAVGEEEGCSMPVLARDILSLVVWHVLTD
jgi:hypothetical protein